MRYRIVDLKQRGKHPKESCAYQAERKTWRGWKPIAPSRTSDWPIRKEPNQYAASGFLNVKVTDALPAETAAYKQAAADIVNHVRSGSAAVVAEFDINSVAKLEVEGVL